MKRKEEKMQTKCFIKEFLNYINRARLLFRRGKKNLNARFGYYYFNNDTNKPLETQLCLRQM